jgi:hypothetical protein
MAQVVHRDGLSARTTTIKHVQEAAIEDGFGGQDVHYSALISTPSQVMIGGIQAVNDR